MTTTVTVTMTAVERDELVRGFVLLQEARADVLSQLPTLLPTISKLATASSGPNITIGVHGGLVQWVLGNPFPVRVCDYDGEDRELPDIDERDQKCVMWFEPVDEDWQRSIWRDLPERESA